MEARYEILDIEIHILMYVLKSISSCMYVLEPKCWNPRHQISMNVCMCWNPRYVCIHIPMYVCMCWNPRYSYVCVAVHIVIYVCMHLIC
jgi:hypothetical protein